MGKNQFAILAFCLVFCKSSMASNPFESFIGTYRVSSIVFCAPEDRECKSLTGVRIERLAGTSVLQLIELRGTKEDATRLVEIPCPGIISCEEFANIEGHAPETAAWDYSKNTPSSSYENHDEKSIRDGRRLTNYGELVSYDQIRSTYNGADYNRVNLQRTYNMKKLRSLATLSDEPEDFPTDSFEP